MFSMLSVKKYLKENNDINKVLPCSLLMLQQRQDRSRVCFPSIKTFSSKNIIVRYSVDDFSFKLDESLVTNKISYPADKGSHLLPSCPG